MAKIKQQGICCICGKSGNLHFEHVPPKAAYNKTTVIEYEWEQYSQNRKSKGKSRQGGVGAYTLCEKCNNDTGSWYGSEYVKWARTCYDIMLLWDMRKITYGSVFLSNIHPLRFLKQAVTCFFSLIGTVTFSNNNPALARFVLEKHNTSLPPALDSL